MPHLATCPPFGCRWLRDGGGTRKAARMREEELDVRGGDVRGISEQLVVHICKVNTGEHA